MAARLSVSEARSKMWDEDNIWLFRRHTITPSLVLRIFKTGLFGFTKWWLAPESTIALSSMLSVSANVVNCLGSSCSEANRA